MFEAEFSMLSDRLEAESDDIFQNKTNLAYQTFQKPHHSENDKFWSQITLPSNKNLTTGKDLGDSVKPVATKSDPTPIRTVDNNSNNQEQTANIFIIKSQTKSGAKRVAKMNRILALDPIDLQTNTIHSEPFFTPQQRCQTTRPQNRKADDLELPSETQWIFSPQNLQRIPKKEIQRRQQNTSRNNITIEEGYLLTSPNNDATAIDSKLSEQKQSPKPNLIKLNPQIVKKLKIQIKSDIKSPAMPASSSSTATNRSKVQVINLGSPKAETMFKARPNTTQISTRPKELQIVLTDPKSTPQHHSTKGTPNLTIRKFDAFFGSPSEKLNTETTSNEGFLVGRLISGPSHQPIKVIPATTSTPSASSGKRNLFIRSAIPSSEINLDGSMSFKTASERSSTENGKASSENSLATTATTPSSDARGRKKSLSMSKGQAKVLNKLFNFDN